MGHAPPPDQPFVVGMYDDSLGGTANRSCRRRQFALGLRGGHAQTLIRAGMGDIWAAAYLGGGRS